MVICCHEFTQGYREQHPAMAREITVIQISEEVLLRIKITSGQYGLEFGLHYQTQGIC